MAEHPIDYWVSLGVDMVIHHVYLKDGIKIKMCDGNRFIRQRLTAKVMAQDHEVCKECTWMAVKDQMSDVIFFRLKHP